MFTRTRLITGILSLTAGVLCAAAPLVAHTGGVFCPAQFFDRSKTRIAIRADGKRYIRRQQRGIGSDTISEITLCRGADADRTPTLS